MARPRQRVRLEDGLKLDLNKVVQWPCGNGGRTIATEWTSNRRGLLASALITIQSKERTAALSRFS